MAGDASASIFEIPVSASLSGGTSKSDSGLNAGPLNFGSYWASPITGSGNTAGRDSSGVPIWLWVVVVVGAVVLSKRSK